MILDQIRTFQRLVVLIHRRHRPYSVLRLQNKNTQESVSDQIVLLEAMYRQIQKTTSQFVIGGQSPNSLLISVYELLRCVTELSRKTTDSCHRMEWGIEPNAFEVKVGQYQFSSTNYGGLVNKATRPGHWQRVSDICSVELRR